MCIFNSRAFIKILSLSNLCKLGSSFSVPLPEELNYTGEIPNCRDGGKPLLAADIGVHSCDKNCPEGFRCEYKTGDYSTKKGEVKIS